MSFYDWLIVIIPTALVFALGWYCRRYVKGVADFLAAGRLCGRYVISVGDVANALAIITLTAYVEIHYHTGFALTFWSSALMPLAIILGLTGFCTYRFRETKAMSLGQFLEMRYSRSFRIFASGLRSFSEILANMIMPALAARFFIYFLDLPQYFQICGVTISTFMLVVFITLVIAISIICMGGTLSLVITDTFQGMLCYPLLAVFIIFVLTKVSWNNEVIPVMLDRVDGESFLDPYDVENLRDFNFFSTIIVGTFALVMHRASWIGAGITSAAKSPHEQKMAALLGDWRTAITNMFYLLIAVFILTVLNHANFADDAHAVRNAVADRVAEEVIIDTELRGEVMAEVHQLPMQVHHIGVDAPLSQSDDLDTTFLNNVHQTLQAKVEDQGEANSVFQKFRTLFTQLSMAMTMRHMLPTGLMGLFCLLMVLSMISTDDTRIYSATLTIAQDVVLPLRKKPLTPKGHIWMIRLVAIGVGVIFFIGSNYMSQLDYINMYVALVCTMWLGGCAPVMVFGLYSRFGTTAGAWVSLVTGMIMAIFGVVLQNNWADVIYPYLLRHDMVDTCDKILRTCSSPFEPWIVWRMDAVKFPINSVEFYFITVMLTLLLYIVVSYATMKEPFNLERLFHRGKYAIDGERNITMKWSLKTVFAKIIGITPEYSKGDKAIAYMIFVHSFIYSFLGCFVLVVIWNGFYRWPAEWWGKYFFIVQLAVPGVIAVITTVWFGIGGIIDLRQLFRDLRNREDNPLDDGRVEGHMSLADKEKLESIDRE